MSQISSKQDTLTAAALTRRIGLAAIGVLGLAALPLIWRACQRMAALLRYPYPQDGLEGTLLHEARLLWAGQPLYQPLERLRFVSAPYPPVHPVLLGLADQLAGPHVFWGGRLISLVSALLVAALIVLVCRRVGRSWMGGVVAIGLFLSAPPVLLWATRIKPDLLALLFTALGLALATWSTEPAADRRPRAAGRRPPISGQVPSSIVYRPSSIVRHWSSVLGPVAAAICFVLAFFTKQTTVAAPLASGLALLIGDMRSFPGFRAPLPDRRAAGYVAGLPLRWRTLVFGASYAALALGTWALLDMATRGQFTAHVWGLHRSEWWTWALLLKFVALLAPYWPAALLAAMLLVRAIATGRGLVPACYALVAPISLLGAGETGANTNHLLESLLALSIAAGCAAGWMLERFARWQGSLDANSQLLAPNSLSWFSRYSWALGAAMAALLAGQVALAYRPQPWYVGELAPTDAPARFIALIRATPGEILADDVALLVAAGRTLRYDDPSTMGPASRSGVWNQSGLLQEIAERKFSAILLPVNLDKEAVDPSGRWTTEMLATIKAHYRLAHRDIIYTYVPR